VTCCPLNYEYIVLFIIFFFIKSYIYRNRGIYHIINQLLGTKIFPDVFGPQLHLTITMFRFVVVLIWICFATRTHSTHLVSPVPRNTIWTYSSLLDTGNTVLDCGGMEVSCVLRQTKLRTL
jgi:hypothetical protein